MPSLDERLKRVEGEKAVFFINQEKFHEANTTNNSNNPSSNHARKRKNLDGKAHRDNLLKILKYLARIKLSPREVSSTSDRL